MSGVEITKAAISKQADTDPPLSAAAVQNTAAEELLPAPTSLKESVTLFEDGKITVIVIAAVTLFLLWRAFQSGQKTYISAVTLIVVCAGLVYLGRLVLRHGRPLFTMTAEGILFPGINAETNWDDIENYRIQVFGGPLRIMTTITFTLKPGAVPPDITGDSRCKYLNRTHQVRVRFLQVKHYTNRRLNETVGNFFRLGAAKTLST